MSDSPTLSVCTSANPLTGYLTLADAAKRLPRSNGRRIHVATLWRWCRRGCKGVYLQYFRVGRTIMVTEEGLHRFFTELARLDCGDSKDSNFKLTHRKKTSRSDLQRHCAQQESEVILRRAKIIV